MWVCVFGLGFRHATEPRLNQDGTLEHSYPDIECVLVPLGDGNWKSNQARGNYSTYEQQVLASTLVLSSQS